MARGTATIASALSRSAPRPSTAGQGKMCLSSCRNLQGTCVILHSEASQIEKNQKQNSLKTFSELCAVPQPQVPLPYTETQRFRRFRIKVLGNHRRKHGLKKRSLDLRGLKTHFKQMPVGGEEVGDGRGESVGRQAGQNPSPPHPHPTPPAPPPPPPAPPMRAVLIPATDP